MHFYTETVTLQRTPPEGDEELHFFEDGTVMFRNTQGYYLGYISMEHYFRDSDIGIESLNFVTVYRQLCRLITEANQ
jgi:uncharacterized protein YjaZ